jgi:hypothetical protein
MKAKGVENINLKLEIPAGAYEYETVGRKGQLNDS